MLTQLKSYLRIKRKVPLYLNRAVVCIGMLGSVLLYTEAEPTYKGVPYFLI
jgi:hypothetical protein